MILVIVKSPFVDCLSLLAHRIPDAANAVAVHVALSAVADPEVERLAVDHPLAGAILAVDDPERALGRRGIYSKRWASDWWS